ncbi:MAG: hypothetical protein IKQ09_00980 [Bacteroidales bacterium]|nr:hypothetical protein [Bacteroidales bacterium]
MKKVVLISCGSQKATKAVQAKDMYTSTLFKKSYAYAVQLHPDKIYILSAKYGLLDPNKTIAPYDMTLNKMNSAERKQWANKVLKQMVAAGLDLENDEFTILAGKKYYDDLAEKGNIVKYQIPLANKIFGERLHYLNEVLKAH